MAAFFNDEWTLTSTDQNKQWHAESAGASTDRVCSAQFQAKESFASADAHFLNLLVAHDDCAGHRNPRGRQAIGGLLQIKAVCCRPGEKQRLVGFCEGQLRDRRT